MSETKWKPVRGLGSSGRAAVKIALVCAVMIVSGGCESASPLGDYSGVSVARHWQYRPLANLPKAEAITVTVPQKDGTDGEANSPGARSITLAEAVDIALADNLDLAVARAEEAVAQQRQRVAEAGLYPALSAGAGASHTDGQTQSAFGDIDDVQFNTYDPQVALVYRLNIPAQIQAIVAERRQVEAAALDAMSVRQRLMLRIAELYHALLVTRIGTEVSEQLLANSRELLQLVEAQMKANIGHGANVARAAARVADAQQQLVTAQRLHQQASIRLATALRLDPATTLDPTEAQLMPWSAVPPAEELDAVQAATQRPDVKAAAERAAFLDERAEVARLSLIAPEVSARIEEAAIAAHLDEFDDRLRYGIFVGWTLSFEKSEAIEHAKSEAIAQRLRTLRIKEQAVGEVRQAAEDIRAASAQIPLAQQELDAANDALRLHTARFKAGTSLALEIIEAQDLVSRARLNVARAIEAYNLAQVRLLTAAGVLDRSHLVKG